MRAVILGGCGFVGLNIAARLARDGWAVTLADRAAPPPALWAALADVRDALSFVPCDVTQPDTLTTAMGREPDLVVCGAAITADAARDAAEPERIFAVNLQGFVAALRASRDSGARRTINLSSAAVYGRAAGNDSTLDEFTPAVPVSLYAITKFASERTAERLAALWFMDTISVRLSAVFGPFEYATGLRDTLSPLGQIMMTATWGQPAVLRRPGARDWIYAMDVADAVAVLATAERPAHPLYNITSRQRWTALAWGEELARSRPNFICRLAGGEDLPTVDLHGDVDRPSLSGERMLDEFGWTARFGFERTVADFDRWARRWGQAAWSNA